MATNVISDMLRQKESPTRSRKKGGGAKGSVAILKESVQLGCVSQDSYPRKSIPRESGMLGSKHTVTFSKGTWDQIKKFGKETVHREVLSKSVRFTSVVLARQNSRKHHMRKPCTKNDAPAKQRLIWRKTLRSFRNRIKPRFVFLVKQR